MLKEIVRELVSAQRDMEVVGEEASYESMLPATSRTEAQVVVVGTQGREVEEDCERLALRQPEVGVLALSADGRQTVLFEVRSHRIRFGELSPEQLADAIRGAVRVRGGGPPSPDHKGGNDNARVERG
jgi:DNA-binding NarL/FixJ family response regulator